MGYYLINELGCYDMNTLKALENYIDYKEYGDDTALNENGVFTDYGYVVCNQSDFKEIYNGSRDDIPDEYRIRRCKNRRKKAVNSSAACGK